MNGSCNMLKWHEKILEILFDELQLRVFSTATNMYSRLILKLIFKKKQREKVDRINPTQKSIYWLTLQK